MRAAGGREIHEVEYGRWVAYDERPGYLFRTLACAGCGAPLAMQAAQDPQDPYTVFPPHPANGAALRAETILLADVPSESAPGLPVYGQTARVRRGGRPRAARRLVPMPLAEDFRRVLAAAAAQGVDPYASEEYERLMRNAPHVVDPGGSDIPFLDGGSSLPRPGLQFTVEADLPCEMFCPACMARQLLTGERPGSPGPQELILDVDPADPRVGHTNLAWVLLCAAEVGATTKAMRAAIDTAAHQADKGTLPEPAELADLQRLLGRLIRSMHYAARTMAAVPDAKTRFQAAQAVLEGVRAYLQTAGPRIEVHRLAREQWRPSDELPDPEAALRAHNRRSRRRRRSEGPAASAT